MRLPRQWDNRPALDRRLTSGHAVSTAAESKLHLGAMFCRSTLLIAFAIHAIACGGSSRTPAPDSGPEGGSQDQRLARDMADQSAPDGATDASARPADPSFFAFDGDPFAVQPDRSEGIVSVGTIDEVLEGGAIRGACDAYFGGVDTSRRAMLRCGKEMFFYDPLGTPGIPAAILEFVLEEFADEVGDGFSNYGMIADPTTPNRLPLGLAPSTPLPGDIANHAYTCASCHFAQLPDGRYAVGAPNLSYEYGLQNLSIFIPVSFATPGASADTHHPEAVRRLQPLLEHIETDSGFQLRALGALAPLLGDLIGGTLANPMLTTATEGIYESWEPGTMDFLIAPLPIDDEVHTISKISALWGIPTEGEFQARGMEAAQLGYTGNTLSLFNFVRGFIDLGGGDLSAFPDERLEPLVEYIYSLRAPQGPAQDASQVAQGTALFEDAGCAECHSGPRGSGLELYTYEAIGTDDALRRWLDHDVNGDPCCGITPQPGDRVTNAIKSPRLTGVWAFERLLHNGSVVGLETLFCL
ncbi:MAG: hypothetical protein AAF645_21155, partial [Myxococcota bacterium]